MLKEVKNDIPCFIQAHSMGCLNSMNFLINNTHIKIDSLIAGSPFWGMGKKLSRIQRIIVKILATFFEEMPLNGPGSNHFLSHDMDYMVHLQHHSSKSSLGFTSGGILNSMFESIEDIHENARFFNKPLCVFVAGKDKIIKNNCTKDFLKKIKTPESDIKIRWYTSSYHNIHKEPEYKYEQMAEIYEFIYGRLASTARPVIKFHQDCMVNPMIGRTLKKRSIKVKRTISEFLALYYLFWGVLIVIARFIMRKRLQMRRMTFLQWVYTVILWPRYLNNIAYRFSLIYNRQGFLPLKI